MPTKGRSTPYRIALTIVATALLVWVALAAGGFFWVWYNSTGFLEVNAAYVKPQKEAYLPVPEESIPISGRDSVPPTRNEATALVNPIAPAAGSLVAGRDAYIIHCAPCHGRDGDGTGLMGAVPRLSPDADPRTPALGNYLQGFVGYQPPIDPNFVQNQPEGVLFWTISNGGEIIMPGFRDALSVEERWHLVNYIKHGLGGLPGADGQ